MRQMLMPCTTNASASRIAVFGGVTMAIHEMRYGHSRSLTTRAWKGPYQKTREHEVVDLIWDNIICRYGIPKEVVCHIGSQFVGSKVTKLLEGLKIKQITSSPHYPSVNGQSESTNKVIIQNLKKKLEDVKGKWPHELPGEPTLRFSWANEETNNEALLVRLDLLEEHRDLAYARMVAPKAKDGKGFQARILTRQQRKAYYEGRIIEKGKTFSIKALTFFYQ
ncbi:uncharacterized protein [Nicotiana tomentosiformis]|uniref:uncharacterized protein n=1 Tax=Nicotiana tomentosiformis TaxID=4098 RepID=UPI00388C87DB